jgi:hypothetical protein
MKTSNKLLIAFGAALILIPILCVAFVSRVYFESGDYGSRMGEMDTYGSKPKNILKIRGNGSANVINVQGESKIHLVIALTKSEHLQVMTSDNLKDLVDVDFDSVGKMLISVKNNSQHSETYGRIAISAPDIKTIDVLGSNGISLQADMDSLSLNLSDLELAQFQAGTKVKYLKVTAKNVKDVSFNEINSLSANLELNNSNVKSELGSFNNLDISSSGSSTIELNGGNDGAPAKTINNLKINTLGKSDVKVLNMTINQCSGKFSDSTTVQMPAINLNQMYRLKK